ncbi:MFS transporter [Ilumatobacter coccineus]|uniref:Putative major facilitator superfamily transporter n=1 Tax=Ilumatobacter coccineus (strain NBRC 103263 / KCTC 29153 / YM16-304) TaxID=1313172 RepID=A0A6C7E5F5_ILUCY|nr:MFS transporter [Ilumatobacter coccineus]BAN01791.1 putative major facilitator superfamily transporter [Ilumatobacter coccineus YM16-304]
MSRDPAHVGGAAASVAPDVSALDEPTGTFPGWRVVAGCFVVLLVNSGLAFYGLAVYLNAFSNEQGWALGSISFAVTVFFVIGGLIGLWVARLIARFDVRIVITIGALVSGGALALVGQVTSPWQLYVSYAFFAVGYGFAGLVSTTTVVTRWFHLKRGVALSVASTGLSVGGIVITPFAKRFIDDHGLAATTPWLGVLFVVGVVPVTWLLIRPDPARYGWEPDGIRLARGVAPAVATGVPYADAVSSTFYKMVTYGFVLALGSQVGGIQQLVKLVEDRTDERTAQFAITVLAATSVVARLIGGRLVSIVPMTRLTVALAGLQCVALAGIAVSRATVLIFASIVLFGLTIGNLLMLQPLLIAERFGVLDYPKIYGRSQAIAIAGVAGGPLLIGWLYDVFGSYDWPYLIAAMLCGVGTVVISRAGPATLPTTVAIDV